MNRKIAVNFFEKTTAPQSKIRRITKWNKCIEETIIEFNNDTNDAEVSIKEE